MKNKKMSNIYILLFLILINTTLAISAEPPEKLFDITMDIEERVIENSNELVAVTIYESFGNVPTPVELTYEIFNQQGEIVYSEEDTITVEVEEVRRKHFRELNLPQGEYYLIFKTLYNIDVYDEFRADFEVREKEFEISSLLWMLTGTVITLICVTILFLAMRRSQPKCKT